MNIIIHSLAIEVTRRCNLVCKNFCMRGDSQNINISKENIDKVLDAVDRNDVVIRELLFSGGEPCLNEEIVTYTIEKIINKNLPISYIGLITNGHIISYPIIQAFEKFNKYKKEMVKGTIFESEDFATVAISRDDYHKPLSEEHLAQYKKVCSNVAFHDYFNHEQLVLKTGLATTGIPYEYQLQPVKLVQSNDDIIVDTNFYLTATGFLTTNGDGSYCDMDINNLGHIQNIDLVEMIYDVMGKEEIEKPITKKKQFFFGTIKNPR